MDRQPTNTTNLANVHAILERVGYSHFRGDRASCPHCEGHRQHTVAIHGEAFYCHRCQRGGNVRSLARSQGLRLPPPRVRNADKPKSEFRAWLSTKMTEMANRERQLARRAVWAQTALHFYPDMEPAWEALAKWYHAERIFATFWQSATDKVGRYWLYRAWRQHAAR